MMKIASAAAAVLLLWLPPAPAYAKQPHKAATTRDWSRTVAATSEGGMRMGNPAARVKLVEYGSLACPHCRTFEQTGYQPLVQRYVRTGQVSYEFRNLLISGPDISITLLAHCAGPARFFPMSEFVYSTQPQWQGRIEGMSADQLAELDKLTDQQRVLKFAEVADFDAIAARFGVSPARARQCLTDPKQLKRLLDVVQKANSNGINHTPTFLINGKIVDGATWPDLEPQLKSALGRG